MTTDHAATAAAEAIRAAIRSDEDYAGGPTALARVAVAAARPIIEAEVRERIAAEERAVQHYRVGPARCACGYDAYKVGGFFPDYHAMFMAHLDDAARIARGTA